LNSAQINRKGVDAMNVTETTLPANQQVNEQQAIAQLKHGNINGLVFLVQTYQVEAVHAALLILGDRGLAEEIVQETFLRAYQKIDQFDLDRRFGPWFLRSVINAALKVAEKQSRREPLEETPDGLQAAEWLIDPEPGPQEVIEANEAEETIWRALALLTPAQRAVIVMRYFLDESEAEMIEQLNRPLTTIKWWLHSARQRLRQLLRPKLMVPADRQEVEHE
jgi:RNA polymerase sigma-70 factor, ECF subfamily